MIMPLLGKVAAVMGGTVLLCGTLAYSGGVVDVDVQEKTPGGHHIHLPLPALAGPTALALVPARHMHFGNNAREIQQWMPVVRVAVEELARCPDGPLVDVQSARETVHIAKEGSYLVIDVNDTRETVHISFPIRIAGTMAAQLADRAQQQTESSRPAI
jgi:hypothetical protein